MIFENDYSIIMILNYILGGHSEISHRIIKKKNELELCDIREYIIENDFYNWLTYDIDLRNKLGILINIYDDMDIYDDNIYFKFLECIDDRDYRAIDYIEYYDLNRYNLGLNHEMMRKKSIIECYCGDWWRTTKKSSLEWQLIHDIIRSDKNVYVYQHSEYFLNFDFWDETIWREPETIGDRFNIIENYYKYYNDVELINGYILADKKLRLLL